MKQLVKNKTLIILIGLITCLTGCENAKYNVIDSMLYIKETKAQAYSSQKIPIRDVDLPVFVTPCTGQVVKEDMEVQASVNQETLEAYNKRYGTDYALLPDDGYSIENSVVTIKQGKQDAPSIKVTFKPITEEMMKSGKTYALPVNIASNGTAQILQGSDLIVYIMDPLRKISAPVINKNNNLEMKMRQDYSLKEWTVEYKISLDRLGEGIGKDNNQAMFDAKAATGESDGQIYTRFGDAMIDGRTLQIKCEEQGCQVESKMLFNINTWYHIAYVNDGKNITIYVNGVKEAEKPSKGATTNLGKNNFRFGTTSYYLRANMKLSELRFWTKAVTPTQLQNNMFNVDPTTDGLEAYWKLDEGSGNEFADATGHGNICTSTGYTEWKHNIIADNKPDNEVEK